jgi:NADP-dependent 3-hydroxy acid dehydrogenase YdfG
MDDVQARRPQPCALITGAATGIGRATARLFVAHGWFVGLGDIDEDGVAAVARELGSAQAMHFRLDVTDPAEWTAALDRFAQANGRLDVLVNNAGILISGPFEANPLARHHALVDVNVKGVLNGCHLAKPALAATPGACVVNLSSSAAIYGQPSLATYSATKFAVRGLTEALNIEWQADGIRVVDVMPLFVRTGMVTNMNARSIEKLGVHLTPEDVAATIWEAATYRGGYAKVHWAVGAMATWLRRLTGVGPDRVSRYFVRRAGT